MVEIKSHSGIYTLKTVQELNIPITQAWDFFSSPKNLQEITPNQMGFRITSDLDKDVYPGQIITYKVGIFPGVKQNWVTEITHVKEHEFFIDEQRFGPYSMWHHEHWFEALSNDTTKIIDKVSYKIPLGVLGRILQQIFIKKKLIEIFEHRYTTLDKLFNEK
ncbi:SRPBCC family protein [Tenacibaculum sp. SG-28]|uniref:SRPBCC family protein n=1 Tax=Tenacibaculum sp. SG-28 TaxID=754426 RepID=UPI000CF57CA9|nr:SRPBCC family protein [Tenacibaculum sp. SG-28]PQJ23278.1 hypothetical protein BSU00_03460 [Tenacibaculum sp. SG-28]